MHAEKVFLGDRELSIEEQIEFAEHDLMTALSHLNELLAKRNEMQAALEANIDEEYQKHLEIEAGKLTMLSDKADSEIAHEIAVKYLERNTEAYTKVVPTNGDFCFGDLVLVDKIYGQEIELGKIGPRPEERPEVSEEIPF